MTVWMKEKVTESNQHQNRLSMNTFLNTSTGWKKSSNKTGWLYPLETTITIRRKFLYFGIIPSPGYARPYEESTIEGMESDSVRLFIWHISWRIFYVYPEFGQTLYQCQPPSVGSSPISHPLEDIISAMYGSCDYRSMINGSTYPCPNADSLRTVYPCSQLLKEFVVIFDWRGFDRQQPGDLENDSGLTKIACQELALSTWRCPSDRHIDTTPLSNEILSYNNI